MFQTRNQVHRSSSGPLAERAPRISLALWLAFILIFLGTGLPALAQLDTGAIAGTILDPAGKVVVGGKGGHPRNGYRNCRTRQSVRPRATTSFRRSVPETMTLRLTATGFKTAIHRGVVVSVGVHTAQDITLAIGAATETVSVTAGAQALESDTSEVDVAIQPEQVEDLPLTDRGRLPFPGNPRIPGARSRGSTARQVVNRPDQDQRRPGNRNRLPDRRHHHQPAGERIRRFGIISPSVDAVSEFHISLSGLPAELGRTTGGVSNFNTKGGTNDYHGKAYEFCKERRV